MSIVLCAHFVKDILPDPEALHGLVNYPKGAPLPSPDDTVIDMKRTILAICWLAVNQSVGLLIFFSPSHS